MWPPSRNAIGTRLIEVEEEAGVGERAQQIRVDQRAVDEADERADPACHRAGDRDERVPPRIERLVAERDVGAEEGDEDGYLRVEPLPLRLDVVPELVDEDEEDEPEPEAPAPDQRVAADGEKHAEELQRAGDLEQHAAENEQRGEDAAEHSAAPRRRRWRAARRQASACRPGSRVAHDPCPIHSSPPT